MKSLMSLLLAVLLAGCASQPAPAVSAQAPPPEPVPSSSAPEEPSAPAELPLSARLSGREAGADAVDWELEVTDPEELRLLGETLSPDGLTPLTKEQDIWLNHDGRVEFTLCYPDRTVTGLADPRVYSRIIVEEDRGTIRVDGVDYAHPAEQCDRLLDFLLEKEVMEPEPPQPRPGELPLSVALRQVTPGIDRVYVNWELEVTNPEEVQELIDILSPDGLTPIRPGEASAMIPDGGSPVSIELRYAGTTVSGYSFAQEWYRYGPDGGSAICMRNACYAYPAWRCDRLIAFLEQHHITVTG